MSDAKTKVVSLPDELKFKGNYKSCNIDDLIETHKIYLKNYLKTTEYNGDRSGRVIEFKVNDGYAYYMFAETEDKMKYFLYHLNYYESYHYEQLSKTPKSKIIDMMGAGLKLRTF